MRGVEWQFSAALAPWWGGFWERMVRTVKDLFRKANGKAVLNYDQFHTALTDVQAVINSRPLVYVGEDDDESHPLTPFNLLHGHPSPGRFQGPPPNPSDYISAKSLTRMDRARRKFVDDCSNRFIKEYLTELTRFHSKGNPTPKVPRIGEVVVIHDDNAKRLMWSTGIVKQLLQGRDGLIRSAKVKTSNGSILTWPIQRLHPIELQEDQPEPPKETPATAPILPVPASEDPMPQETTPDTTTHPPEANDESDNPDESPAGDSGGEYVGNIYTRRAGSRRIMLSRRAKANLAGKR